jgi:hypothetical protein
LFLMLCLYFQELDMIIKKFPEPFPSIFGPLLISACQNQREAFNRWERWGILCWPSL